MVLQACVTCVFSNYCVLTPLMSPKDKQCNASHQVTFGHGAITTSIQRMQTWLYPGQKRQRKVYALQ